jgi:hypothetical protein
MPRRHSKHSGASIATCRRCSMRLCIECDACVETLSKLHHHREWRRRLLRG